MSWIFVLLQIGTAIVFLELLMVFALAKAATSAERRIERMSQDSFFELEDIAGPNNESSNEIAA